MRLGTQALSLRAKYPNEKTKIDMRTTKSIYLIQ